MIIFYNIILALIRSSAARIDFGNLRIQLDIRDVNLWVTGGASIQAKRSSMLGGMDSLKIVFCYPSHSSKLYSMRRE